MGNLVFNGVSTKDMGVVIQTPPVYEFPNRVYEKVQIEGRSGDLIIDKQSYMNVKRTYHLAMGFRKNTNFVTSAKTIVEWLLSVNGYARLEDSYEPEYYRMALVEDPGELPNLVDEATVLNVSFNCKPQRYLKEGDNPLIITDTGSAIKIFNNTKHIALPEITMKGENFKINFASGNNNSSLETTFEDEFIVNSETQDCYNDEGFVNNEIILKGGFPKLYPGMNTILVTEGTLTKLQIKPRWWTL